MLRSRIGRGSRLQAVDEVRGALGLAGRGKDRAVVCLENIQPARDIGGVVLTRLKREIKIGTEERGAKFGHEFFDRVPLGPETLGATGARQARFVCGPMRLMPISAFDAECRLQDYAALDADFLGDQDGAVQSFGISHQVALQSGKSISSFAPSNRKGQAMNAQTRTALKGVTETAFELFGDYLDQFRQHLIDQNHSEHTVRQYVRCIGVLAEMMEVEKITLEDLDVAQALELVAKTGWIERRRTYAAFMARRFVRFLTG